MKTKDFNGYHSPFAERFRDLIKERNDTQANVASTLKIARQTVSMYYNGQTIPTADKLLQIADHFNVSTDYLLGRTNAQTVNADVSSICDYTGLSESAIGTLHDMIEALERYQSEANAEPFSHLKRAETVLEEIEIYQNDTYGLDPFPFLNYMISNRIRVFCAAKNFANDIRYEIDHFQRHTKMLDIAINDPDVIQQEDGFTSEYLQARRQIVESIQMNERENVYLLSIVERFGDSLRQFTHQIQKELIDARDQCLESCIKFELVKKGCETNGEN